MIREQVAVVGSGLSGLTAAFLLRKTHAVTLYEAGGVFGGSLAEGDELVVPTRDAPVLTRLLHALDLATVEVEVSASIACDGCGLEYGAAGPRPAVFAQTRRMFDPRFRALQREAPRISEALRSLTRSMVPRIGLSYGDLLAELGIGDHATAHFALPLAAGTPGVDRSDIASTPARLVAEHLDAHGLLGHRAHGLAVADGGPGAVVDAVTALVRDTLVRTAVTGIERTDGGVLVSDEHGGQHRYAAAVLAVSPAQALSLLADPTPAESQLLATFRHVSETVSSTDDAAMPRADRAWATWNHRSADCGGPVSTTTWLPRTQRSPDRFVTVSPAPSSPTATSPTAHAAAPTDTTTRTRVVLDEPALAARRRVAELRTPSTLFAGSWTGNGTAEAACRSGVAVAAHLGVTW